MITNIIIIIIIIRFNQMHNIITAVILPDRVFDVYDAVPVSRSRYSIDHTNSRNNNIII